MNVLFLCSRNRLRSPTAEEIFRARDGWEVASAGLAPDADEQLSTDTLDWADVIFVMENAHKRKLTQKFSAQICGKRVICLDIPDDYDFMQPELVALLTQRINAHFPPSSI